MVTAETQTLEANAIRQLRKLHLHDCCICIHPEGRVGGIWLCWTEKINGYSLGFMQVPSISDGYYYGNPM
ncbi:hypothetical protein Q3G72_004004 [Acer saccharum]|nr:hypothetical protein Q3G72_004004 [Acer saccharum]